jgi:hypothetical protein
MAATKSLVWAGDAVTERMRAAQIGGVKNTMGACVVHAKRNHTWVYRTAGGLDDSIMIVENAAADAEGVRGVWGVTEIKYALIQELGGTIQHPGGTAYYIDEETGLAHFVANDSPLSEGLPRTKPHEIVIPARPYLRPAADAKYPDLPKAIREAYDKSAPAEGGSADG